MIPSSKIPSSKYIVAGAVALLVSASATSGLAQGRGATTSRSGAAMSPAGSTATFAAAEYRIGPEDVLDIKVQDHDDLAMLAIAVRPDGRISMPLLNDIQAAGLTPMELRAA